MTPIATAAVYIGVNILILLALAVRVVGRRRSAQISIGTGGDGELEQRVRAHGNASEYIPVTMIGLFAIATLGAPLWAVHAVGGVFTLGRVLHGIGMSSNALAPRALGMVLTWTAMLGAAGALMWMALAPV